MTATTKVTSADAALVRQAAATIARLAQGEKVIVEIGDASKVTLSALRLRALADVLDTITPIVVRVVQREEEELFDAADSMDTSPGSNPEWRELKAAAAALESLLTEAQRVELAHIANTEPL